jgi:hypothetical protein
VHACHHARGQKGRDRKTASAAKTSSLFDPTYPLQACQWQTLNAMHLRAQLPRPQRGNGGDWRLAARLIRQMAAEAANRYFVCPSKPASFACDQDSLPTRECCETSNLHPMPCGSLLLPQAREFGPFARLNTSTMPPERCDELLIDDRRLVVSFKRSCRPPNVSKDSSERR